MTLPTNITLPIEIDLISADDPQELVRYIRRLVYAIASQIQISNLSANGSQTIFSETLTPNYPFIQGSTSAGAATYSNTTLIVRRTNLLVFVWFDISWTGHTGTGNLLVTMPYFATPANNNPFSCVIEADSMTFTAGYTYLTGNITPNTNTIGIFQNGSGQPILALPISADGHLRGSIVYAGQQTR